jgi:soluble lytic murein transglycosylase-like protein
MILLLHPIEQPIAGIDLSLANSQKPQTAIIQNEDKQIIIDKAINDYGAFYDVDQDLIRAIIGCESEGDTEAFNSNDNGSHDRGLMQINSCNYDWLEKELGITDFYDPEQNIRAGTYILSQLHYDDLHQILMSYNMGETRMKELWSQGITSSRYSRKVIKKLNQIKEEKVCG